LVIYTTIRSDVLLVLFKESKEKDQLGIQQSFVFFPPEALKELVENEEAGLERPGF